MNRSSWTKKAVAIPACTMIVLGGVALGAAPAMANPADLKVTSQSVTNGVLTLKGLGTPGEDVILQKGFPAQRFPIAQDGTWTLTYTLPDTAAHTYELDQQNGLNADGSTTITVAAQTPTPASQFSLTSPTNGATVQSRTVVFSGTGTPGDTVNLLDASGNRAAPQVLVGSDGKWTTVGTFSASAPTVQKLSVNQVGGAQGQGTIDFTITLPATTNPSTTLTVTAPADGATVPSRTVTFTGTGVAGDAIAVVNAQGQPVAAPTEVRADGTWTTTGTFSDAAAARQELVVGEVDANLALVNQVALTITLPAATSSGTGSTGATGTSTSTGASTVGTLPVVSG